MFAASEAWLAGDAERVLRVLSVLEAEGDGPQLAIWSMSEDLHALGAVQAMTRRGMPIGVAMREARVWGKRQSALERAARRLSTTDVERCLAALARIDALGKGIGLGAPWDELGALALEVAGTRIRPLATLR